MALVRANDTYTLCEFAYETTYGTAQTYTQGYTQNTVRRFPFVAENIKIERETLPLSEEFTPFAGLSGVDLGKSRVRGTITVEPQYQSQWFWMLFGLAFSYEDIAQDKTIMDQTITDPVAGNVNTHIFNHGNVLKSTTMWIWKSGPTASASTWVDRIVGLYVTKWTWEQPEGNRARVVLEFIGKEMTTVAANTLNAGVPATIPAGVKINVQHLGTGTNAGLILFGSGAADPVNLNLTGFTIAVDRKIDDTSGAFINDILSANDPGIEGIREVDLTFTTNMEQDYNAATKPWPFWVTGTQAAMHIRYDSGVPSSVSPAGNFAVRFDIPGVVFTDFSNNISQAGVVQISATAKCPLAAISRMGTTYQQWPTIPTNGLVDVRVATVMQTPTPAPDGMGEFTIDTAVTGFTAAP